MSREVVLNENGDPLDYFVFSVSQKIGLPNYSSVDVFASIGRTVENSEEARREVVIQVEELLDGEVANIKENLGVS